MSYDIWLEIDTGGPEPATVAQDWNYTSNCAPMWRAAGAPLADFDGELADTCLPVLNHAIAELENNPDPYRAMDPENGWGSYDSLLPALRRLRDMFAAHPRATVRVSR